MMMIVIKKNINVYDGEVTLGVKNCLAALNSTTQATPGCQTSYIMLYVQYSYDSDDGVLVSTNIQWTIFNVALELL
jgi:hypothetical protein